MARSSGGRRPAGGNSSPWYAVGLRFACRPDCGACCTSHGDYEYVYLDGDDIPRLAAHLDLPVGEFLARYTDLDDGYRILKMDRPDCPFLDGRRCAVYPARPSQCRTFPFWGEHLTDRGAWRRLARFCPGVDRGDMVPLRVIQANLRDHGDE